MSKPYEIRTLSMIVLPEGEAIFSEMATEIKIEDEAGGEFVSVSQCGRNDIGKILIDRAEWTAIRAAIDHMIGECRPLQLTDQ